MNKVLVIEARNIFNIKFDKISLIHPKSYVHAIIKFDSGMIKIINKQQWKTIFNSIYESKMSFNSKKILILIN